MVFFNYLYSQFFVALIIGLFFPLGFHKWPSTPCLSFVFSLSLLCVCTYSLFLCLCLLLFSLPFFFFFARAGLSLFIEKFQRNCSLIFSQLINSWSSLRQFFSPQLLILCSAVPHYFHFSDCWQVTPLLLRCGVL